MALHLVNPLPPSVDSSLMLSSCPRPPPPPRGRRGRCGGGRGGGSPGPPALQVGPEVGAASAPQPLPPRAPPSCLLSQGLGSPLPSSQGSDSGESGSSGALNDKPFGKCGGRRSVLSNRFVCQPNAPLKIKPTSDNVKRKGERERPASTGRPPPERAGSPRAEPPACA